MLVLGVMSREAQPLKQQPSGAVGECASYAGDVEPTAITIIGMF
jgi:hypothetical protein